MADLGDIAQLQLQSGFDLPPENKYYANSVAMGTSAADVILVLHRNNEPVAVINMSHQLAKTLAIKLNDLMKNIEERTGQRILTTDEIGPALAIKESE